MITALTPIDFKRRAVRLYPRKTAVIDGEKRWTYAEFDARTWRLSNALRAIGVGNGDHVAVMLPNTHAMLECFFGVCQIGAVMVPINIRLSAEEIQHIVDHSDATVAIVDAEYGSLFAELRESLPRIHTYVQVASGFDSSLEAMDYEIFLESAFAEPSPVEIDENQTMTINYTSGTTSMPKGVILTHRNNYMNAVNVLFHLGLRHEDVYLHTLPMFHVNGWGLPWAVAAVGGTQVCLRKMRPEAVLDLFAEEQITLACGAPTVLSMLINAPGAEHARERVAAKLRMATAASPPPAAIIDKARRLLGMEIIHVYGLTEVAPLITYCEWRDEFAALPEAEQEALRARQGVELLFNGETKVVRDDLTEVCWDGQEVGEIAARGNVVMAGYYKQPEATAKAIRDGWFLTGDLAVTHPNGYIEIVDRAKDVIISGGENISSVEVEGVLYRHEAVLEAGVVAVPHEKWGEAPKAYVIAKPGAEVSEADLREWCRAHLAHFKVPHTFEFVESLPRTSTGKLQKYRLREENWAGHEKRVH